MAGRIWPRRWRGGIGNRNEVTASSGEASGRKEKDRVLFVEAGEDVVA